MRSWIHFLFPGLILALILWSLGAFAFVLWSLPIDIGIRIGLFLVDLLLWILLLWSFVMVVKTHPNGRSLIANQEEGLLSGLDRDSSHLEIEELDEEGNPRVCKKECQRPKPPRCRHCSTCRECILKFDHHCPWLGNCIGWANQKLFVLFLGYGFLYCLFIFSTLVTWRVDPLVPWTFYFFCLLLLFSAVFGVALGALFMAHFGFCFTNQTTNIGEPPQGRLYRIPSLEGPPIVTKRNFYDRGWRRNLRQVFGEDVPLWKWFLPIVTVSGTGTWFPVNPKMIQEVKALYGSSFYIYSR